MVTDELFCGADLEQHCTRLLLGFDCAAVALACQTLLMLAVALLAFCHRHTLMPSSFSVHRHHHGHRRHRLLSSTSAVHGEEEEEEEDDDDDDDDELDQEDDEYQKQKQQP